MLHTFPHSHSLHLLLSFIYLPLKCTSQPCPTPFIHLSPSYPYQFLYLQSCKFLHFMNVLVFVLQSHLVKPTLFGGRNLQLSVRPLIYLSKISFSLSLFTPHTLSMYYDKGSLKIFHSSSTLIDLAATYFIVIYLVYIIYFARKVISHA